MDDACSVHMAPRFMSIMMHTRREAFCKGFSFEHFSCRFQLFLIDERLETKWKLHSSFFARSEMGGPLRRLQSKFNDEFNGISPSHFLHYSFITAILFVGLGPIMTPRHHKLQQFSSSILPPSHRPSALRDPTRRFQCKVANDESSACCSSAKPVSRTQLELDYSDSFERSSSRKGSCSPWSVGGLRTFSKAAFGYNSRNYKPSRSCALCILRPCHVPQPSLNNFHPACCTITAF